jgi:hypothetical protein
LILEFSPPFAKKDDVVMSERPPVARPRDGTDEREIIATRCVTLDRAMHAPGGYP